MRSLIFDGNNLIHRTFWTAKHVNQQDESLTGLHVYLTINSIKSAVQKFKPTNTYIAWDTSLNRQERARAVLYQEYKGNRSNDSTPHENNDLIIQCLNTLGVPSFFPTVLEADDVISYLADTLEGETIIVSADKDFLQKVNDGVSLYDPIRKNHITLLNFEEHAKCRRDDFMKIKCITGDKSDNVSGIPGYGKVKVQKVINNLVQLSEADQVIYDRNYNLFRLDRYTDLECVDEYNSYTDQLNTNRDVKPNFNEFIDLCKSLNIQNVLVNKEIWYSIFFKESKLLSLFNDRY